MLFMMSRFFWLIIKGCQYETLITGNHDFMSEILLIVADGVKEVTPDFCQSYNILSFGYKNGRLF